MKTIARLLLVVLVLSLLASGQRLPQNVVPEHYDLTFTPDLKAATFAGDAKIDVRILKPTQTITLHAAELEFQKVTVTAGKVAQKAEVKFDPKAETATLTVPKTLKPGAASIHIVYTGNLNDQLRGFYLAKTKLRNYATTQMEPTDGRRAFPGFDEPAFKATFDITVVADKGDRVFSNMREVSDTPGPAEGKHTVKFATTPRMSTYLVAMVVGDFECLEGASPDGIAVRVCTTPGKKELGKLGLAAAEQQLAWFNQYYGVRYPFGKLDVVAVPDFSAGAMENAGLITYRESMLLVDEQRATLSLRRMVADVMSHEIAHMWFGDLVTMKWWDDIWLNEGFASWASPKPVAVWKPEWKLDVYHVGNNIKAMNLDALQNARPVRSRASGTAEISQLFSAIIYEKAAGVLRMMENYLGPQVFQAGVQRYLKKHAYGNAGAEDFFAALAAASNKPVGEIMRTFVDQPGVPQVNVSARCEAGKTLVTLGQQRYSLDPAVESGQHWHVPVCLRTSDGPTRCELLTKPQQTIALNGCSDWVYANAEGHGYYRTAYDAEAMRKLAAAVSAGLKPTERLMLVDDAWASVRSGRASVADFLTLADAFKDERESAVVANLGTHLRYISDHLVTEADRPRFEAWVQNLLRPAAQELGYESRPDDSADRRALRSAVLYTLGWAGRDPEVIAFATRLVERAVDDPKTIDATLFGTMTDVATMYGGPKLYEKLVTRADDTSLPPNLYYTFLYGLTTFRDPELVKRALDLLLTDQIRSQDSSGYFESLMQNPVAQRQTWEFMKAHWEQLKPKFATYGEGAVAGYAGEFCDAGLRDDAQRFFDEKMGNVTRELMVRASEEVNNCIRLRDNQTPKLANFLNQGANAGHQ